MTFEFLASAVICHHVLAFIRPLTVALQQKDCDIFKAHEMAQRPIKALKNERSQDKFSTLWSKIKRIASTLNMQPAKKRTVATQRNRAKPSVEDIESHSEWHISLLFLIMLLITLIQDFQHLQALLATYFIPQKLPSLTDEVITKLRSEFEQVLPYPSELENEVSTWKVHMALTDPENADSSVLLHTCWETEKHREYYPNIHTMLMLLLSLPVGTCSCERSFSSLRRLKTWCRNSMSSERLDALAIGYINHKRTPSPVEVLKVWDRSGNRKIATVFNTD